MMMHGEQGKAYIILRPGLSHLFYSAEASFQFSKNNRHCYKPKEIASEKKITCLKSKEQDPKSKALGQILAKFPMRTKPICH